MNTETLCRFCNEPAKLYTKPNAPAYDGPRFEGTYTEALCPDHKAGRDAQAAQMTEDMEYDSKQENSHD